MVTAQLETMNAVRDAAAQGRLLVMSGAGISCRLRRPDSTWLPSWSELVAELRKQLDPAKVEPADKRRLRHLLPHGILDKLHGDVLIEASEIIQKVMGEQVFLKAVAALCSEAKGQCSDTHRAIAKARPAGIITFNYDHAHEEAFRMEKSRFVSMRYNQDSKIRNLISSRSQLAFIMKAHGSTDAPGSLILSSSAYRRVLSNCRAYRTFLQYCFINYTVLIVGFSLRDRDFDQVLNTLEVEWGRTDHRHAFIAKLPERSDDGRAGRAHLAAITSRFGVHPLYVADYPDIPDLIEALTEQPGPLVQQLLRQSVSREAFVRAKAHDRIEELGPVGRAQVRQGIFHALGRSPSRRARSELIYALRGIGDDLPEVAHGLIDEIRSGARDFTTTNNPWSLECVAHGLLALRRSRLRKRDDLRRVLSALCDAALAAQFQAMDDWLRRANRTPRILAYAQAAHAEIEARSKV